jgi:hypothetical protein
MEKQKGLRGEEAMNKERRRERRKEISTSTFVRRRRQVKTQKHGQEGVVNMRIMVHHIKYKEAGRINGMKG